VYGSGVSYRISPCFFICGRSGGHNVEGSSVTNPEAEGDKRTDTETLKLNP